jgi:RNA recognition motif-containing protein
VEQKLNAVLTLAGHDKTVIDGEQLLETVQQALDTKFLPNQHQCLDLYLAAIRIVKRRLLFLLARGSEPDKAPSPLAYDNAENPASNNKAKSANAGSVDEETIQEVKDLLDDMEEMYDEVDSRIRKTHASWSEGRALLWKERAQTEALLTKTLRSALEDGESAAQVPNTDGEVAASFAKSVRLHNPAHPDLYASYIHNFSAAIVSAPSTPVQVMSNLRRIRFLYENAITSTGKSKSSGAPTTILRDYDTALSSLCQEWIDFERVFGSERSLAQATKMVQKKLRKAEQFHRGPKAKQSRTVAPPAETEISAASAQPAPRAQDATATAAKRKHDKEEEATENVGASDRPSKKQKTESTGLEDVSESKQVENEKAESEKLAAKPRVIHKVKVGDLEHPAHPFTVRILHLSPDTGDMDLVDAFRPKCGSVVHARVVREKSHRGGHGKSKGWALIQFEERDSVEKALELSGSLALHEKTLKVERSHLPAVSLVPAGMHRVRPKGEGKMSKRNEKRREHKGSNEPTKERDAEKPAAGQSKHSEKEAATCVLAFRPRGVGRAGHQKPRLSLDKGATKK